MRVDDNDNDDNVENKQKEENNKAGGRDFSNQI